MHIRSQPSSALPDDSGVRSACRAHPANSSDGVVTGELLLGEAAERDERQPGEVAQPGGPGGASEPQAAADGWERREQRVQERGTDARPVLVDPLPRGTVTRGAELEVGHAGGQVAAQDGRRSIDQRVGEHVGGVGPGEPVGVEIQRAHDRRCGGQRVEGAEEVVAEAGRGDLAGPHGSAGLGVRLEDEDLPALVGQDVGGDQPVGTGADDDGVDAAHRLGRSRTRCSAHDGSRSAPVLDHGGQVLERLVVADVDRRVHDRTHQVADPAHRRFLLEGHHAPCAVGVTDDRERGLGRHERDGPGPGA